MTITVKVGLGETISEALIRAGLMAPLEDAPHETITIPFGVCIVGSGIRSTQIVDRRTSGIPFLNH